MDDMKTNDCIAGPAGKIADPGVALSRSDGDGWCAQVRQDAWRRLLEHSSISINSACRSSVSETTKNSSTMAQTNAVHSRHLAWRRMRLCCVHRVRHTATPPQTISSHKILRNNSILPLALRHSAATPLNQKSPPGRRTQFTMRGDLRAII